MRLSNGIDIDFLACDDKYDGPTTELVFRDISKQIVSVDIFIKEILAFFEGNYTQAEIYKWKTFLAYQMEECKAFLNRQILAKKTEMAKTKLGGPKGKLVSSSIASNKKHRTHGTAHMRYS